MESATMSGTETQAVRILLVDDSRKAVDGPQRILSTALPALELVHASDASSLDSALGGGAFDLVLTEQKLRWSDGIRVLKEVSTRLPGCPVILYSASFDQQFAVDAMKEGAKDYVLKSSAQEQRLRDVVRRAIEARRGTLPDPQTDPAASRVATDDPTDVERPAAVAGAAVTPPRPAPKKPTTRPNARAAGFRCDTNGQVIEVDAGFLQMFGFSGIAQARGLRLRDLFCDAQLGARLLNLSADSGPAQDIAELHTFSGSKVRVSVATRRRLLSNGQQVIEGVMLPVD